MLYSVLMAPGTQLFWKYSAAARILLQPYGRIQPLLIRKANGYTQPAAVFIPPWHVYLSAIGQLNIKNVENREVLFQILT